MTALQLKPIRLSRAVLICAAVLLSGTANAGDHVKIQFSDDLKEAQVKACFAGSAPRRLTTHDNAKHFIKYLKSDGNSLKTDFRWNALYLKGLKSNSCIDYGIDLVKATKEENFRQALNVNGDILLATDLLFWQPSPLRAIDVEVILPEGMDVSAPWALLESEGNRRLFRPDLSPTTWGSKIAVGRFRVANIDLNGSTLRVATVGNFTVRQRSDVLTWMEEAARSVAQVHGKFPQPSPQLLVVAIGERGEPIPWAQVMRGGGVAGHFYIDQHRSLKEFSDDWTPTHELAHMLIPFVSSRDRWLSEGLASYYQNVLRGRDGRLPEAIAWQKLHAGFERGVKGTQGLPLSQASRDMGESGSYMRVYWSGAAILMLADVELRRRTNGEHSLDSALEGLYQCCMANTRSWRARELFDRLDEITGTDVFSKLYQRHVGATDFPDAFSLYEELGLVLKKNRIKLDDGAPYAGIRRAIAGAEE